jgi:hypothetical protein
MSSTHSDSNSQKVYRQPEKPTIQDVIAAWKEIETKVEEMFEKVRIYVTRYKSLKSARAAELEKPKLAHGYQDRIEEDKQEDAEQILAAIREVTDVLYDATCLTGSWTSTVRCYAEDDSSKHVIVDEAFSHIKQITKVIDSTSSVPYSNFYFTRGNYLSALDEDMIGIGCVTHSCDYNELKPEQHGKLIKESIAKCITTLEQVTCFFSSPLP